jgi:predicted kinase
MKSAIFMMGLPASGKTSVARIRFPEYRFLDCDAIKATHPDYNPKNPELLHAWSKAQLEVEFAQTLADQVDFVFDGTGTAFTALIEKIRKAELQGYRTKLVYVTVPLRVSLERNAKRTRVVPEHILIEKAEGITIAFEIVSKEVSDIEVIDNSGPRN